jgi:four helix bundle protein
MKDFHKLKGYQPAFRLALDVMKTLDDLPNDRDVLLQRRITDSALKIPAKLANGCGRGTRKGLLKMTIIASGHAASLDSLLMMAHKRELLDETKYGKLLAQLIEVRECLDELMDKLVKPRED